MAHPKFIRILYYVWLFVAFPVLAAVLVGLLAQSANLRIKAFLLIEFGMAVLMPLLNAVITNGDHSRHKRGK